MKYKGIIFDLDGTLVDTIYDLTDSINFALKATGHKTRSVLEIKSFIGNGMKMLVLRSLDNIDKDYDKVYDLFCNAYENNCIKKSKPYDGIEELLLNYKKSGIKLGVVTNKNDLLAKKIINFYFPKTFDIVIGATQNLKRKPSSDMIIECLRWLSIDKDEAIIIGDSEVDYSTAINAKIDVGIVKYGYQSKKVKMTPTYTFNTVDDIKKIFN